MKEIVYQLECVKKHLNFIKTRCNQVDFDVEVLEGCISRLNDIDQLIFPHTIGTITFYSKEELIEWIKSKQTNT